MTLLRMLQRALQFIASIWASGRQPTRAELFYSQAITHLGTDASPNDEAVDSLACVESIQDIYFKQFGRYIGPFKTLSTYVLLGHLNQSPEWQKISLDQARPGDLIISPTGYSKLGSHISGHLGVVGENGIIMSNNSFGGDRGMFTENYTVRSWKLYFQNKMQFPVYCFHLL